MARRPDDRPPSLAMVAAGGFGVLAVVAFVAAVAFGARPVPPRPGDRVGTTRQGSPPELAVAVARCPAERVTDVALLDASGAVRWRITSAKGSIDERYVVGGEAPTGFETAVPLDGPLPHGRLEARVAVERDDRVVRDRQAFRWADVPGGDRVLHRGQAVPTGTFEARSLAAVDCPSDGDAVAPWLFVVGAGAVVVTYAGMVGRWWRGDRRP